MSDEAAEVRRLLAPLRDRPVSVDQERMDTRRPRVISALKLEMGALRRARLARPRRRAAYALACCAAALCVVFGARFVQQRNAPQATAAITFVGSVGQTLARGATEQHALNAGEALSVDPGEIETAANGSADLVTKAGLGLRLGSATRVSLAGLLDAKVNQVELRQGVLTCSVPHLHEGQRFSVKTPDARVVVHGTVFSVHVDAQRVSGTQTCVEVTDGVVIVQHGGTETALNAGDHWGCDPSAGAPVAPASVEPPADSAGADRHLLPRGRGPRAERSTLNEENRLFQAALAAERLGQRAQAQGLINQLLSKYPSSPLAPEARRALSRLVVDADGN